MLLTKRLNPATVEFDSGAAISLNTKLPAQYCKQSIAAMLGLQKSIPDMSPDELLPALDKGAVPLDDMDAIIRSTETEVEQLLQLKSALTGETVTMTTNLTETGNTAFALTEAMKAADPQLDLSEIDDMAARCGDVAEELAKTLHTVKERRGKADKLHKHATLLAMAQHNSPAAEIFKQYELPDWCDFDPPPAPTGQTRLGAIGEPFYDDAGNVIQRHGIVERPQHVDADDHYRAQAKRALRNQDAGIAKSKRARKRQQEAEIQRKAQAIWSKV